jgi:hypothetical protein
LELEVSGLWSHGSAEEANYATFLVMHEEQRVAEGTALLAVYWTLENVIVTLAEHFIGTVIDGMQS